MSDEPSAAAAAAAKRQRVVNMVCASSFLSVLQHIANLQTEPVLLRELTGDLARTTSMLANTRARAHRAHSPPL